MTPSPVPLISSSDNKPYIQAILVLAVISTFLIVAVLYLRPLSDPLIVIGSIVGVTGPTTFTILTFMKANEAKAIAQETHLSVNSRLDQFIATNAEAARAEGVIEGTTKEQARVERIEITKKEEGK